MTDKMEKFEADWDEKYIQINLDPELYPHDKIQRRFFIITGDELNQLNRRTDLRIKRFNRIKPKGLCEYE